ncbi:MAG: 1-acyl-sn-glycerol-3-phosphate acyltransferase [Promethearchaeota archaeon]
MPTIDTNFLNKWVYDPINDSVYGIRKIIEKMGYLKPLDHLFLRTIEDPLLFAFLHKIFNLTIQNANEIPDNGPVIIVQQGDSRLDPMIIAVAIYHEKNRVPFHIVDSSLGTKSRIRSFYRANQAIFIRTGEEDEEGYDQCHKILSQGEILLCCSKASPKNKLAINLDQILQLKAETKAKLLWVDVMGSNEISKKTKELHFKRTPLQVKFSDKMEGFNFW